MKSVMYLSPKIYNFFLRIIHRKYFLFRYKEIARSIGKNKKVLDLGCGTGLLYKFLDKSCEYEGWDLNEKFLKNMKGINTKYKNVFDFDDYPTSDVIVICDLLHHVMPRHKELLITAKEKTKRLIVLESKSAIVKIKNRTIYFLYKVFDTLIGDSDGINSYDERMKYFDNKEDAFKFFSDFNPLYIKEIGSDYLIIFDNT